MLAQPSVCEAVARISLPWRAELSLQIFTHVAPRRHSATANDRRMSHNFREVEQIVTGTTTSTLGRNSRPQTVPEARTLDSSCSGPPQWRDPASRGTELRTARELRDPPQTGRQRARPLGHPIEHEEWDARALRCERREPTDRCVRVGGDRPSVDRVPAQILDAFPLLSSAVGRVEPTTPISPPLLLRAHLARFD